MAAGQLAKMTPPHILNVLTTGSQPRGYRCLHLLVSGSDKALMTAPLVRSLVEAKADREKPMRDGSTAYLIASGQGLYDVVKALEALGATIHARSPKTGKNAADLSNKSSMTVYDTVRAAGSTETGSTTSGRLASNPLNASRANRRIMAQASDIGIAEQFGRGGESRPKK